MRPTSRGCHFEAGEYVIKVQVFWEGHKNLVTSKLRGRSRQSFVAFSEFMSFTKFLGSDVHINRIKYIYFKFTGDDLDQWVANKCADKVDQAFVEAKRKGRGVAAFICEPCFVSELLLYKRVFL